MSITFACGQCGKPFTVEDKFAGKKGRCKQCGALMMIPTASLIIPIARAVDQEISPSRRAPTRADAYGFEEARPARAQAGVLEDEDFTPLAPRPKRQPVGSFDPPARKKRRRQPSGEEPGAVTFLRILLGLTIGSIGVFGSLSVTGQLPAISALFRSMGSKMTWSFGGGDLDSIFKERIELNNKLATYLTTVWDVRSAEAASASANQQIRALTANLKKLQTVRLSNAEVERIGQKHLPAMNAATHYLVQQFLRIASHPGVYEALNVNDAIVELEAEEQKLGLSKGTQPNFRRPPSAPIMPNVNPQPNPNAPSMPNQPSNYQPRNRGGTRRPTTRSGGSGGPP